MPNSGKTAAKSIRQLAMAIAIRKNMQTSVRSGLQAPERLMSRLPRTAARKSPTTVALDTVSAEAPFCVSSAPPSMKAFHNAERPRLVQARPSATKSSSEAPRATPKQLATIRAESANQSFRKPGAPFHLSAASESGNSCDVAVGVIRWRVCVQPLRTARFSYRPWSLPHRQWGRSSRSRMRSAQPI